MSTIKVDSIQTTGGITVSPAKAAAQYDQSSTTITFSVGISSVTDTSTGRKAFNFSNSFSSATSYAPTSQSTNRAGSSFCNELHNTTVTAPTSGSYSSITATTATVFDSISGLSFHGDF